jgi:hypothetical protein
MRQTVYGVLADPLGLASDSILEQGPDRPELRHRAWATPAAEVRNVQDPIRIDRDHDHRWIGELIHLERSARGDLWAVGHLDEAVIQAVNVWVGEELVAVDSDLYWSASRWSTPDFCDVIIGSVSLTAFPARNHAQPVTILDGALSYRGAERRWRLDRFDRELLERAADTHVGRERGAPLVVYDPGGEAEGYLHPAEVLERNEEIAWQGDRPPGPLRHGPRGRVLSVH